MTEDSEWLFFEATEQRMTLAFGSKEEVEKKEKEREAAKEKAKEEVKSEEK